MTQVLAVFKRELSLYFRSPIAYAVAFAVLLFLGVLFASNLSTFGTTGQYPADAFNINPAYLTFLMFLVAPLLTMRLLAEETREGTLEVLMTMPMSEWHFIVGKFLAAWAYFTVVLALTLVYVLILAGLGQVDGGRTLAMYLGTWFYGGATIALALIWSSVTEDQVVAAFLGAATVLLLYFANQLASAVNASAPWLATIVRELGLQAHYNTMQEGVVRAHDVLYFVFIIVGALFITTRIVETRRWRA